MAKQWDTAPWDKAPPLHHQSGCEKPGSVAGHRLTGAGSRGWGEVGGRSPPLGAGCTPCHSHVPPWDSGSPVSGTAGLPNASTKNHSGKKSPFHAWLAPLGQHFKPMEPATDQRKELLSVTITTESDGTGGIRPHQK